MVPLGAGVVALAASWPGVLLMRRFGGASFPRAADESGGLVIGKIAGFAFWALFAVSASLALREFSEAFSITILPRTPIEVIILTLALTAAYSAYLGPEVVGRLTIFLTPWLVLFLIVILLAPLTAVDLGHIFPFWGTGLSSLLRNSLQRSSLYADATVLLVLYPYLRVPAKAHSVAVWAIALAALVFAFVEVVIIMVFDVVNTDRLVFPIVSLARLVAFGRFLTRVEALGVLLWVFLSAVQIAVLLWAAATTLAETLRLPSHRPLFAPLTTIVIAGCSALTGEWQAARLDFQILGRWAGAVAFVLPLGLWLLSLVRGKKAKAPLEGEGSPS